MLQSPRPTTTEPRAATTEVRVLRGCALQREKLPQWEARAQQQRVAPALRDQRKTHAQERRPNTAKINK